MASFFDLEKKQRGGSNGGSQSSGGLRKTSFFDLEKKYKNDTDILRSQHEEIEKQKIYSEPADRLEKTIVEDKKPKGLLGHLSGTYGKALLGGIEMIGSAIKAKGMSFQNAKETDLFKKGTPGNVIKEGIGRDMETFGKGIEETMKWQSSQDKDQEAIIPEISTIRDENGKIDIKKMLDYRVALTYGASAIGSMIPGFAMMAATKNPKAFGVAMGLQEKGDAFTQYTEELAAKKGIDVSKLSDDDIKKLDFSSDVYGAISYKLENLLPNKAFSSMFKSATGQGLLRKIAIELPKTFGENAVIEALGEGSQKLSQNIIGVVQGSRSFEDIMEGVADEAYAGGIGSAPFSVMEIAGKQVNPNIVPIENAPKQPKEEEKQPAPSNEEATRTLVETIATGEKKEVKKAVENASEEDLAQATTYLEKALEMADEDVKPSIQKLVDEYKSVVDDRKMAKNDALSKVIAGEDVEAIIDGLPKGEKAKVIETIEKAASVEDISPEAKASIAKATEKIAEVRTNQEKIETEKAILLEKKKQAETPEEKKAVQAQIDEVDKVRKPEYAPKKEEAPVKTEDVEVLEDKLTKLKKDRDTLSGRALDVVEREIVNTMDKIKAAKKPKTKDISDGKTVEIIEKEDGSFAVKEENKNFDFKTYYDTWKRGSRDISKKSFENWAMSVIPQEHFDEAMSLYDDFSKNKTQKEKVIEAISGKEKTIKEIAEETKILEPNVRRILGVGAKEGVFERLEKGVYVLSKDGVDTAWVEVGNAIDILPKLVSEGKKFDSIYSDLPYRSGGNIGGNRPLGYSDITPEEYAEKIVPNFVKLSRNEDTPIIHIMTSGKSSATQAKKYNAAIANNPNLKLVAVGEYVKLRPNGKVSNMGKYDMPAEIVYIYNQSGNNPKNIPATFNVRALDPKFVNGKNNYKTQKAIELVDRLINYTSQPGEHLLDAFAGSGMFAARAVEQGRKATTIEINENVVKERVVPNIKGALSNENNSLFEVDESGKVKLDRTSDGKGRLVKEMNEKELKKSGLGVEAMGYGNSADVFFINGKPAIAMSWIDEGLAGFSVAEEYRGKGLSDAFLKELIMSDPFRQLDVVDANDGMLNLLKRVGTVTEMDGAGIVRVIIGEETTKISESKNHTKEEFYLADIEKLAKKYGDDPKYSVYKGDDRFYSHIANDHFDELDEETQRWLEFEAHGIDFESPTKPQYRGFANADEFSSGTTDVHAGQIFLLRENVDLARQEDLTQKPKESVIPNNKQTYGKNKSETIPDAGNIPTGDDLGGGSQATSETSGYDRATMLAQSGDGLGASGSDGARLSKRDRQNINEQVETLLESKEFSANPDDYTQEERAMMSMYSGAGGKESVGGDGVGLLNEYYTPQIVIDKMWQIAKSLNATIETAFEPSAGIGKIMGSAPVGIQMDGAEISKVSGTVAKILNPNSNITIGDFQELFFDKTTNKKKTPKQYDLLIGNPPFGVRGGFLKGKGEESKIGRMEEYFIKRGLDMTVEGGYLVYVVNSSFLQTKISHGKEKIAEIGKLVAAYRLPEKSFEDTSIGTDIVVFKKEKAVDISEEFSRYQNIISDGYFGLKNKASILGEVKFRKNRFGKDESYVSGSLEEAMERLVVRENAAKSASTPKQSPIKIDKQKNVAKSSKKTIANTAKNDIFAVLPKKDAHKLVHKEQNISNKEATATEIEMLKKINRDMSVENPTEEEKGLLNFEKGQYYPDAIYFSGNIYEKIEKLKASKDYVIDMIGEERYNRQMQGLEKVLPKEISIEDIVFDPIDRHVANLMAENDDGEPVKIMDLFLKYLRDNKVALSPRVGKYDIQKYVRGENFSPGTKPIVAEIKADSKRLFNYYLVNILDKANQAKITEKYNREKNGYVRPDYSKIPVVITEMIKQFRGMDFKMSQTQKEGVGFLVNKGSGLIAYGVGVGKTHTLAIATKANMDKGWTKRPLFIVPNATIEETWIKTLHEMFPNITINNLSGLQAPVVRKLKKERGEVTEWIKDGEMTVISHKGILRLGFKEEELVEAAGNLNDAIWIEDTSTKRKSEEKKGGVEEILGRAQKFITDVMLSDLGIDHISVDEVHNFRKIFQGAKAEKDENGVEAKNKRFTKVIGGTPAKQAQQLFLISQHIQKKNNNRNVFLASATPYENQATEVYNILSLIARDRMKEMGILNINDFFATYSSFIVEKDRSLTGEWINREKMIGWSNLHSLQKLVTEFMDFQEDETLVRPEKKVFTPHLQMSEKQEENSIKIQNIVLGIKDIADDGAISTKEKPEDGAFLKASMYAISNSVSPYFIEEFTSKRPDAKELMSQSPKLQYALETAKAIRDSKETKGLGIFIYMGKQGVSYHPMLSAHFAKELGYKPEEVAHISGSGKNAISDEEKENIKRRFNSGDIKILFGGDQTKEGIDLQKNGFVTINVALGWNPTEITQTGGRVWRQGNRRNFVLEIFPLVENSGDAMMYNKFEEKSGRINQLNNASGKSVDIGEVDASEKKLSLLTNPEDKAKLQIEANKVDLTNEKILLESEAHEIGRLLSDKVNYKNQVDYYVGISKEEWRTAEQRKEYKKEAKKWQTKLDRVVERTTKIGVDLSTEVLRLENEIDAIDKKIAAIDETYPGLLEKFTNEYREMVKSRKSIPEHVEEIKSTFTELREFSDEELAQMKLDKIKEVESRRTKGVPAMQIMDKFSDRVDKILSTELVTELVQQTMEEVNPHIREALQIKTFRKILSDLGGNGLESAGQYDWEDLVVRLSRAVTAEEFVAALKHEIRHHAFNFMSTEDRVKVIAWYKSLSENQLVEIYGSKKMLNQYRETYSKYENYERSMADETVNQMFDRGGLKMESWIVKIYNDIIELFAYIFTKIFNKGIELNKAKIGSKEIIGLYADVFSQIGGQQFAVSQGRLAEIIEVGGRPGMLSITANDFITEEHYGDNKFVSQSLKKDQVVMKDGKLQMANLFKKVWVDMYGTTPPAFSSLTGEKIARSMTKRSFTLGKRYGSKITKQNISSIRSEIKKYVIKKLPIAARGKLVREISNAKNKEDVEIIIKKVDAMVAEIVKMKTLRKQAMAIIRTKNIQKDANLRKAMELPPIRKMNEEQLKLYIQTLSQYQKDDTFLSQRAIETSKFTEIGEVKTIREAREKLLALTGDKKALLPLDFQASNKFLGDSGLSERHPFFEMMAHSYHAEMLKQETNILEVEKEINERFKKARASRVTTFGEKLVPADERIFNYLNSGQAERELMIENMTTEEIDAAEFTDALFREMYEKGVTDEMIGGSRFVGKYVPHIARGFFEGLREAGFKQAIVELFENADYNEKVSRIISGQATSEILAYRKFFRFKLKRTGEGNPSKNVAKATMIYARAFHKKQAIDAIRPKVMIYMQAFEKFEETEKGLKKDSELQKFVKEWLNAKAGRTSDLGGLIPQHSLAEQTIKFFVNFTRILDLGLSIAAPISNIGEQGMNYVMLGAKKQALGIKRMYSRKGRLMLKNYKNFTGKGAFSSINEAEKNIADKTKQILFVFFRDAQVRANKQFLLASITDEEWQSEKISDKRLAEIKVDMGRWRVIDDAGSIIGKTAVGEAVLQYKSWATMIARTTFSNLIDIKQNPSLWRGQQGAELGRAFIVLSVLALIVGSIIGGEEDEKSATGKAISKALRDMMSATGAVTPTFWLGVPRSVSFLYNGSIFPSVLLGLKQLIHGERYQKDDSLKGVKTLEKVFTPSVYKQFIDK